MRPMSADTPAGGHNSCTARSASSFASPYGEIGRGVVLSVNGGSTEPAYTPPADEARKTSPRPADEEADRSAIASRKLRSTSISCPRSLRLVLVTPTPAHQATRHE